MRLLNVDTFQFEEFFYQTPPPYAVLSHTWGDDSEEVSYSNVLAGRLDSPETRPAKVTGCCNQARKDGYQYVWIDTCCIDKTNSVELQEAINSMFKWYRKADICYVYLADVPPGDEIQNPDSRFHSSRWFQRGWTLQELLAPLHLRFYDTSWECLGTKGELCETIEGITGIPKPYLLGIHELHHASIAQRMSWAASRVTKREEDIAYCLLGIFDIVMSMIYGEGPNAFRRLQEHIMLKHTTDDSILAWGLYPTTPSSSSSALANHPSQFALSGQIVSRPRPGSDSLDLRAGTIRLHLRIFSRPDIVKPGWGFMVGALRCGPDHDPQMLVCLPLICVSGDEDREYTRMSHRCATLQKNISDCPEYVPCRIRADGKPRQSTAPIQAHFFHIQRSSSARNLEIVDVQPPERWLKERSLIEAPAPNGDGQQRAFLRLRDGNVESNDFVIVLEAVASGPVLRAQCDVMTASKDTPLSDIQGVIDAIRLRSHQALRQSANNGVLTLRAALASEAMQGTFSLRLEKLSDPPAQTTNVTFELENMRRTMEIECLRKVSQAVAEKIGRLKQKSMAEVKVLEDVHMELLEVDKEMQSLLERKARLEDEKASLASIMNKTREVDAEMDLKREKLITWTGAAEEQLKSLVNNTPIDTEDEQVRAGHRILHQAAENGYNDLVQVLVENGAPIEEPSKRGWTPLHAAASNGHMETVRLLLDKGANIDAKTNDQWTPLQLAVQKGHESIVRELLRREAKMMPTSDGWMPLHLAAQHGFESIAQCLLSYGADVAARSNRDSAPLHIAAHFGHLAVAQLLLAAGADVKMRGKESMTPLHLAAGHGHDEVVSFLLDKGASIASTLAGSHSTPLHIASQHGHVGVVRLLLKRGAASNVIEADGSTPLHSAAARGWENIMRLLIEHGADIGAKCKDGSALALAAYYGHEDAVRFLVSKGANIADQRALAFANRPGSEAIARILKAALAVNLQKSPRQGSLEKTPAKGKGKVVQPLRKPLRRYGDFDYTQPAHPPLQALKPMNAGVDLLNMKDRKGQTTDDDASELQSEQADAMDDGEEKLSPTRKVPVMFTPEFKAALRGQSDRDMKASAERATRNPDKRGVPTEPAAPPRERVESGVVPGPRDRSKAKLAKGGWRGTLRDVFFEDPDLKQRGAQH